MVFFASFAIIKSSNETHLKEIRNEQEIIVPTQ